MSEIEPSNGVHVKLPLFSTHERQVYIYGGQNRPATAFVEEWRVFDIQQQNFLSFAKQVHLGLRIGEIDITGNDDFNTPDPIRLFRGLQILNSVQRFPLASSHADLMFKAYLTNKYNVAGTFEHAAFTADVRVAYEATGQGHLSNSRAQAVIEDAIGADNFYEILQSVPENLQVVIENLHEQKIPIYAGSLSREIAAGRVETNPLYEKLMRETRRRRRVSTITTRRFFRQGLVVRS